MPGRCASSKGSLIGSAEYAISHLHTKLLIVTGHTKCGAVTAALQTVHKYCDKNGDGEFDEDEIEVCVSAARPSRDLGNACCC